MRSKSLKAIAILTIALCSTASIAKAEDLGKWFTHLSVVDPSIIQDMRYYGTFNFLGSFVDGYEAPECILTKRAANALKRAQAKALSQGFSLKVHDCYRPKKAVAHFVRWAKDQNDQKTKALFYPRENKALLFERGYIAHRSGHSRGSTVDLTVVQVNTINDDLLHQIENNGRPCHNNPVQPEEIGVLEMETRFDCLDVLSTTASKEVSAAAQQNRKYLNGLMASEGFKNTLPDNLLRA